MRTKNARWAALGAAALCCAVASTASGQCVGYNIAPGPASFIAGTTDTGNHCDDCVTPVALPFPVSLYGVSYNNANVSSNGNIQFSTTSTSFTNACLPTTTIAGPAIFPLWDDLYTSGTASGQGIFTSVSGVSPSRVLSIEWRATNCCATTAPVHNFCVIFYENQTHFDIVYAAVDAGGNDSTVGVQAGSSGPAAQYQCNVATVAPGTSLRFTCQATAPSGTCCASGNCTFVPQVSCASPGVWTLGGACSPNPCPQPLPNDLCSGAITISEGVPAVSGDNTLALTDPGEVFTCQASSEAGVWYDFTADADGGAYQIDTEGSSQPDTILAVYDFCGGTSLACDDDSGTTPTLSSKLTINLSPNQNVKILLGTYAPSTPGAFVINITQVGSGACCNTATNACTITASNGCTGGTYQGDGSVCSPSPCPAGVCCDSATGACTVSTTGCAAGSTFVLGGTCTPNTCPVPPANDNCAGAATATVGSNFGTLVLATNEGGTFGCQLSSGRDVYYTFLPPADGSYQFSTCGGIEQDTTISLHTGCPASAGNQLTGGCVDQGCGSGNLSQFTVSGLVTTQTYIVRVALWSATGTPQDFTLNITQVASGACCNNSTGACSVTTSTGCSTTTSTYQGDNTTCTPTTCGTTGACCSSTGTCTQVLAAGCTGTSVFQGDNTVCSPNPCPPTGSCCDSGCCTVTLQVNCTGAWTSGASCSPNLCGAPANDTCASASVVTVGANAGSNCGATTDFIITPNTTCGTFTGSGGSGDVWHSFTPTATATYTFDTCATPGFDTVVAIYASCPADGTVAPIACNDDGGATACSISGFRSRIADLALEGGVSYLIRVAAYDLGTGSVQGQYVLNIAQSGSAGACCDGSVCTVTTPVNCTGTYQNDGSTCSPNPCGTPATGACCCGSSCTITTAAACTGVNRAFAGPGTSCTPFSNTVPCCRGDYNKTGAPATVQDIFDFLGGYFSSDPCADSNDTGGAPTVQDIFDFLGAYFGAGC